MCLKLKIAHLHCVFIWYILVLKGGKSMNLIGDKKAVLDKAMSKNDA